MKKYKEYIPVFLLFIFGAVFFYFAIMSFRLGRIYPVNDYTLENRIETVLRTTNSIEFYTTTWMFVFIGFVSWGGVLYLLVSAKMSRRKRDTKL